MKKQLGAAAEKCLDFTPLDCENCDLCELNGFAHECNNCKANFERNCINCMYAVNCTKSDLFYDESEV